MVRETRHLGMGNLPENVREEKIIEHFKRASDNRERAYEPNAYGHHERGTRGFDRTRHYDQDYYRDPRERTLQHGLYYSSRSRSPSRFDAHDPRYEPRAREHFTLPSVVHRDIYRDDLTREVRGRRPERSYQHSRSRSPHSSHSRTQSLQRLASQASRSTQSPSGNGSRSRSSSNDSINRSNTSSDRASDNRERAYEPSAYGHHEWRTRGFDRMRHYDQDYYRDPRERTLQHGLYYSSRSHSPSRFDAHDPRYEPRAREQFTLPSVVHRDIYRDDLTREVRGRRPERSYQHSRSRSPHSSQSRTQSPQRLASQASRSTRSPSGIGSRSRSSSSDSINRSSNTNNDSSDSCGSASDESPARSVQSTSVPAPTSQLLPPLEKDEPRKSFGIKVQNLPVRSTDTSLKDGLFHEFKKCGKVTCVQIHGDSEERYGLVFFRQQEDQKKALNASKGKLFFGMQIEMTAWIGPETENENEFRPPDERINEFHPKATRTLFIGNLEKTTTCQDLCNIFQRFGGIVDIHIKRVNGIPQYAFLQFSDISSVCKAIKKMDGEYLGNNRLKLGFGKSMPTNCVWLDGLATSLTDQYLTRHFFRYGPVVKVVFDRLKGMALVLYNEIEYAQAAVKETKRRKISGNKIKVDFANRESQLSFYRSMEKTGQDIREFYEMLTERRDERRGSYDYAADRTYHKAVRTPGTYPEDPRRDYPARGRDFYADWDPYQGDYYDPQYYDDPREYRDYRGDTYDQDIREYSYRQRERFESDREHKRRPLERSQSPAHSRLSQSPSASPSQSEQFQSDSERRIYSRSSERSGSCSSLSPPRYDKLDKSRLERYTKNENPKKERAFEQERLEEDKRLVRKEKPEKLEKEKREKQKRKAKVHSPSSPSSETDVENEREPSPKKSNGSGKQSQERAEREAAAKNRLDLMPCVVLTRVREKEGKVLDQPQLEKLRGKLESDPIKPPLPDQKMQISQVDQTKLEPLKLASIRTKVPKEKVLASHVEGVDKDGKVKPKRHLKSVPSSEVAYLVDLEKLEARKRRFAEANLKSDKPKMEIKRSSQEEEEGRVVLKKETDVAETERKPPRKEAIKRETRKIKLERFTSVASPKDATEPANLLMIRMSTGHMEGTLQLLYLLLTDCYVYLIRKGAAEKPYMVEEAVSYNELDYISVGLDQQTVTLVCTNRRRQFQLDTADATLTEFFLTRLRSAMIKGCRELPYPSILTDATMEKLVLAKFVAQESKKEISEVVVHFYGLVHWEDPTDENPGPPLSHYVSTENSIVKEGVLNYKAGTNYLGKEVWKPCFVVLSNGILYQYPDRTDVTPLLSVNMGGEQCGGCRKLSAKDRPHSFQVILTERPSLELSAENEEEMADWMQYLCQAVSQGVVPQGMAPAPCVPCCLVVTEQKLFTCHKDCQTSFFRSLATADLTEVDSVSTQPGREYCLLEFAQEQKQYVPPWVLYFSCPAELERFLLALDAVWKSTYKVDLLHKPLEDSSVRKKCEDALSLIHSTWQPSDSLCHSRASRDP